MSKELTIKAQNIFSKDIFAVEVTGIQIIDVEEGYSCCELKLADKHRNAIGAVMGGVIFTLADFSFAVAANTVEISAVSLSSNINFLCSSKGSKLIAVAKCLKSGQKTCFYDIIVKDDLNKIVASISTVGSKIK